MYSFFPQKRKVIQRLQEKKAEIQIKKKNKTVPTKQNKTIWS